MTAAAMPTVPGWVSARYITGTEYALTGDGPYDLRVWFHDGGGCQIEGADEDMPRDVTLNLAELLFRVLLPTRLRDLPRPADDARYMTGPMMPESAA